jgi:hypothetical protein
LFRSKKQSKGIFAVREIVYPTVVPRSDGSLEGCPGRFAPLGFLEDGCLVPSLEFLPRAGVARLGCPGQVLVCFRG